MDALDELKEYCLSPNPIGGLLLTGEWGCGKTYLIENNLKEELRESHIIIRVSLFGIDSIQSIHDTIKELWINEFFREYRIDEVTNSLKSIAKIIKNIPLLDKSKQIASFDILQFIRIQPKIKEKCIILVFDDLDRSFINKVNLLGMINDYIENLKFHTIIIVNEKELIKNSKKNEKVYPKIKEKIIERTILYSPDYNNIISNILKDAFWLNSKDSDYKNFLIQNKQNLVNLFDRENRYADKKQIELPQNIRCFKYAIKEFFRVYNLLVKNEIKEPKEYLYCFIICYMIYKSGQIDKHIKYSELYKKVQEIYPNYDFFRFMFKAELEWILKGDWNEEMLLQEIIQRKRQQEASAPEDILKESEILNVDESLINAGFDALLSLAYDGRLSLNEYINFISNANVAQNCNYKFPTEINWGKVEQGIDYRIGIIMKELKDSDLLELKLKMNIKVGKLAYQKIIDFRASNKLLYAVNKNYYIENLKDFCYTDWEVVKKRKYDAFDKSMAEVTSEVYCKKQNKERWSFQTNFIDWIEKSDFKKDSDIEKTIDGLLRLNALLDKERMQLQKAERFLTLSITTKFVENIDKCIKKLKQGN